MEYIKQSGVVNFAFAFSRLSSKIWISRLGKFDKSDLITNWDFMVLGYAKWNC